MPPLRSSRYALAVLLAATLGLAACSSSGGSGDQLTTTKNVGAALAGTGTLPAPASAWPEAGFDARYSSGTTATGPQTGHVKWTRNLGGDATPGPVVGIDGTILAATQVGVLHDLDPKTGQDVWTYDGGAAYGTDLSTSPAVLAGGTILWPGPKDTLYALSPAGKLLWSEKFKGQVLSPAIAGMDRVYVADLTGHLEAIEVTATTHRVLWTVDVGGTDYGSPTVGPDGAIYTASDDDLVAVRDLGSKGAVLFRFQAKKMVEVSNAVAPDGTVVLGTNHDKEFGIAPDGSTKWAFDVGDYTYSSSVVRPDGTGYFGDNMGRLHVIDTATGKQLMTISPLGAGKEKIWTSVAADAKGDFYWGTTAGNIYGYDAAGKQLFHVAAGAGIQSYPAIDASGTLYLGTTAGTLYAIGG